ncbi:hypothetical protein ACTFIZ_007659 [Dictyostelium cf. discoideum]
MAVSKKSFIYTVGAVLIIVLIFQMNYYFRIDSKLTERDVKNSVNGGTAAGGGIKNMVGEEIDPTIFVSLAAYRDVFCSDTINYIFNHANRPEKIFIGIVDQGSELLEDDPNQDPSLPNSHCYRGLKVAPELIQSNVRRIALTVAQSKGPTLARYHATTLYNNETYFMQVDSHLRFIKGWDSLIINDLWLTKSYAPIGENGIPRTVLTHYPMAYNVEDSGLPIVDQTGVPRLCKGEFNSRGIITFNSFILKATTKPAECPYIAAGFFFTSGEAIKLVPFDPHLSNLFEGEEILYSVRMYSAGFRFFAPTLNVCYHYYSRPKSPKFWEDNKQYYLDMQKSVERLKYILRWPLEKTPDLSEPQFAEIDKYTIHNTTILSEYYQRWKIDVENKKVHWHQFCDQQPPQE